MIGFDLLVGPTDRAVNIVRMLSVIQGHIMLTSAHMAAVIRQLLKGSKAVRLLFGTVDQSHSAKDASIRIINDLCDLQHIACLVPLAELGAFSIEKRIGVDIILHDVYTAGSAIIHQAADAAGTVDPAMLLREQGALIHHIMVVFIRPLDPRVRRAHIGYQAAHINVCVYRGLDPVDPGDLAPVIARVIIGAYLLNNNDRILCCRSCRCTVGGIFAV